MPCLKIVGAHRIEYPIVLL